MTPQLAVRLRHFINARNYFRLNASLPRRLREIGARYVVHTPHSRYLLHLSRLLPRRSVDRIRRSLRKLENHVVRFEVSQ